MAIQLARAIGMQRKPISPLEGLPEIIQKTGSDILSGMQQADAAKAAQAQKEKALGDAVLAKIDITPPKAKPEQAAEFSNYVQKDVVPLITDYQAGKISAAKFNEKARDVIYNLQERRNKYAQDLEAFELAEKPETKQNFHTDDFDSFVAGTPDRVEVVEPEFPMNAPYKEKSMLDVEGESKENIAKPEKKIVAGTKGYLSLPFEEQKKIDVKSKLQESLVPKTVGAQKAFSDYSPNFKPESMITIHKDKRGVITAERDEPLIQRNRDLYVMSILSPQSYGESHDIEKRAIARTAIQKMERDNVPEEQRAELLPEYMGVIAAASFDRMVNTTEEYEKRKTNEEMLKSQSGGINFTFGGGESKKDNYVDEKSYNTDLVARSTYENVVADKEFDKYISDEKKKQSLRNKYGGGTLKSTDREGLKEAWIKQTKKPSRLYEGKTVEEGWIEQTKRDLARYEGLPAISFNNKTAKNVELEDDGKYRQFIPDKVIYKKDGSIEGIEAHAAVQGKDGSYVKKPQSLQVIPITERNFEALKGGFPELFKYAKGRGVNLSYTEGKKAEGAETKKDYGTRRDGTQKGIGYFGELKMKDGSGKVATEITISPKVNGKTMDIPSLVPTLTSQEKDWLLTNGMKGDDVWEQPIAKSIEKKAIAHAEKRIKEGKSVFAEEKEATSKETKPKEYKLTQLTVDFINGLKDGEIIVVDGVKRVKQDGKLKKVKQ